MSEGLWSGATGEAAALTFEKLRAALDEALKPRPPHGTEGNPHIAHPYGDMNLCVLCGYRATPRKEPYE